jgi:hypothetical protein
MSLLFLTIACAAPGDERADSGSRLAEEEEPAVLTVSAGVPAGSDSWDGDAHVQVWQNLDIAEDGTDPGRLEIGADAAFSSAPSPQPYVSLLAHGAGCWRLQDWADTSDWVSVGDTVAVAIGDLPETLAYEEGDRFYDWFPSTPPDGSTEAGNALSVAGVASSAVLPAPIVLRDEWTSVSDYLQTGELSLSWEPDPSAATRMLVARSEPDDIYTWTRCVFRDDGDVTVDFGSAPSDPARLEVSRFTAGTIETPLGSVHVWVETRLRLL